MENKRTVLICLNYFQIGGVETFVYNQVIALLKKGYEVIVLGMDGLYSEKFKKTGAKCINFEFENKNYYDYEKTESFIKILQENKVTEVHNNSFQSMNVVLPACLMTNTPYVVYTHMSESVIDEEFKFFEEHYETYKDNIEMYYKYAERIIAITPKTKEIIDKKFNIKDKNKVIYMRNAINFDMYMPSREVKEIKNILIISRLEELKQKSVIEGIELYKALKSKNDNMSLTIAGDGNKKKEIERFVKDNDIRNVTFLGAISTVKEELDKSDIVIGVGRGILEAIAMKRIAIISGYTGIRDILSEDNFDIELDDNLSGKHLKVNKIDSIAKKIEKLSKKEISEIVDYNYKRAKDELDFSNNLYTVTNPKKCNYKEKYEDILNYMIKINCTIGKLADYRFEKMERDWKEHLKYSEMMESQLNKVKKDREEEIIRLTSEIRMYENSKTIKLANKLKRIIGMKGKNK